MPESFYQLPCAFNYIFNMVTDHFFKIEYYWHKGRFAQRFNEGTPFLESGGI